MENLYNNAFKYAMEHSRIYVDMESDQDMVSFTIKNISENSLNISSAELTERFVRGDVSRTTEGSGLGLSIAQSLTQLQKGVFEIIIDGDLFKVCVKFPVKKKRRQWKFRLNCAKIGRDENRGADRPLTVPILFGQACLY